MAASVTCRLAGGKCHVSAGTPAVTAERSFLSILFRGGLFVHLVLLNKKFRRTGRVGSSRIYSGANSSGPGIRSTHVHVFVAVVAGQAEWGPAGFVHELFVPVAVLPERRGCDNGARVDDTLHRLGPLALLQDGARRVQCRFGGVLVQLPRG